MTGQATTLLWQVLPPLIVVVLVAAIWWHGRRRRRRMLASLRATWGTSWRTPTRPETARCLLDLLPDPEDGSAWTVDEQTWRDLDMDQVVARLDRTISPVGAQVLSACLRRPPASQGEGELRGTMIRALLEDQDLREQVQMALAPLDARPAGRICELLWQDLPTPPLVARLAPLMALIATASVVLPWLFGASWALVLPVFAISSVIHFVTRRRIDDLPLGHLGALLGAAQALECLGEPRLGFSGSPDRASASRLARLRRRLAPLGVEDDQGLLQYVKIFWLVDVLAYSASHRLVRDLRGELQHLLWSVGQVDAAQAVASFAAGHPRLVRPCLGGETWSFRGLWHPLLDEPVAYDLDPAGNGLLITGSNMSGKTTLLKTVGVASILAQSLDLVPAESFSAPRAVVRSSIGRSDNLIEGRSYYLAEVESILRLVHAAEEDTPHLLLADEIFRGTNPEERVAGAMAVLGFMARPPHLVMAATHDLELVRLLEGAYTAFHFRETVDEHGLQFDYAIRPGPAASFNAITLLELTGYPDDVVAAARRLLNADS
jgi:hypothetical protein